MPELLFKLNGVPDDEAAEVHQLLEENNIDFYETPGGNWGISVAGIWLHDKSQLVEAKALLANYQIERSQRMRAEYQRRQELGQEESFLQRIIRKPLPVIALLALVAAMVLFSIKPFLGFGE